MKARAGELEATARIGVHSFEYYEKETEAQVVPPGGSPGEEVPVEVDVVPNATRLEVRVWLGDPFDLDDGSARLEGPGGGIEPTGSDEDRLWWALTGDVPPGTYRVVVWNESGRPMEYGVCYVLEYRTDFRRPGDLCN